MSTLVRFTSTPARLQWWEWGKVLGVIGIIAVIVLLAAGVFVPPAIVALVLHIAGDFTFQSDQTAAHKEDRGRHLVAHALVAGGLPMAIAGLATGDPLTTLSWILVGTVTHYAVDWTRKFGIQSTMTGIVLDQIIHLATIVVVTQCKLG